MYLQELPKNQHDNISNHVIPRKRCLKNGCKSAMHKSAIIYILLLCLPSTSFGWSIPSFGNIFSGQDNSDVKSHGIRFEKESSIRPVIDNKKTEPFPSITVRDAVEREVTVPTGNSSLLIVATFVLGGLVITSFFLYALDVYATSRIDEYLYDYYGPEMYDRYTSVYDPNIYNSPYNTNGYYSATTAAKYYGVKRSNEGNTIGAAARILLWIENTSAMFDIGSELYQEEKCREHLICEVYQKELMSGILELNHVNKLLAYFPLFQRAKIASKYSKSRSEGCNQQYTGCTAIIRAFHDTEYITNKNRL